jgi:hypothetical protein
MSRPVEGKNEGILKERRRGATSLGYLAIPIEKLLGDQER